jgi:hypothetical protein
MQFLGYSISRSKFALGFAVILIGDNVSFVGIKLSACFICLLSSETRSRGGHKLLPGGPVKLYGKISLAKF